MRFQEAEMRVKSITAILISCIGLALAFSIGIAAESPTCDEGPIKNTSVYIDGAWYKRPDGGIDNLPSTDSVGPFPVRATVEEGSGIVTGKLHYGAFTIYVSVAMELGEDNVLRGEIPPMSSRPVEDDWMAFWVSGFNSEGGQVWLDEIPYTCPPEPYTHGDPYHFQIEGSGVVQIDVMPGSDPNSINPKSKGEIPVAILSTEGFDATTVNVYSITFGRGAAAPAQGGHIEDVDGDTIADLVLHFRTQETGIAPGDVEVCLQAETMGGSQIEGCDDIRTVGK